MQAAELLLALPVTVGAALWAVGKLLESPAVLSAPAAHAVAGCAGIKRILIPSKNMRDVKADVPKSVSEQLEVVPVQRLEDVLAAAFTPPITLLADSKL